MTQGFGGMNLGMQPTPVPIRSPTNPMMGNVGMPPAMSGGVMGMAPIGGLPMNQGMMGMNTNMGIPGNMGLGMSMSGMGVSSGMTQPKQDAFADFANFGK